MPANPMRDRQKPKKKASAKPAAKPKPAGPPPATWADFRVLYDQTLQAKKEFEDKVAELKRTTDGKLAALTTRVADAVQQVNQGAKSSDQVFDAMIRGAVAVLRDDAGFQEKVAKAIAATADTSMLVTNASHAANRIITQMAHDRVCRLVEPVILDTLKVLNFDHFLDVYINKLVRICLDQLDAAGRPVKVAVSQRIVKAIEQIEKGMTAAGVESDLRAAGVAP